MTKKIKAGTLYRSLLVDSSAVNVEARTVSVLFSSETPVERWDGYEILDHSTTSVDMTRLNASAPFCKDHDLTQQIGVIESASIDSDRCGRAVIRFAKTAAAEDQFQMIADGIRPYVSVGYRVQDVVLDSNIDGVPTYRVIRWLPFEISSVASPADLRCAVGRAADEIETEIEVRGIEPAPAEVVAAAPAALVVEPAATPKIEVITSGERHMDEAQIRAAEIKRAQEILALGRKFHASDLADQAIAEGRSVDEFRGMVLDKMPTAKAIAPQSQDIGMSDKEVRQFNIMNIVRAVADNKAVTGLEKEASDAVAKLTGKAARGAFLPAEILKRGMVVGNAADGGNLVANTLKSESFIDKLYNRMVLGQLGITRLDGLTGNLTIPKSEGGTQSYWVTENGAPNASNTTISQTALKPHTVGGFSDLSRLFLLQSSISAENFVMDELARALALAIDLAGISGGGLGEPKGLLSQLAGDRVISLGVDGDYLTYGDVVEMETRVATANADVKSSAYLTNARTRGAMKTTERFAGTGRTLWEDSATLGEGMVNGYRALASNQVPGDLSKGAGDNLSAMIHGDFSQLILGTWSGVDITNDPYTNSTTGAVRIVALQDVDVAIRNHGAFTVIKDIKTV
jgi:HK97 family phage major capsid protein